MQTFDQHLLQHLEAGRITMEEAVHVATSPHDFKLMVAAAGKPQGRGPGRRARATSRRDDRSRPSRRRRRRPSRRRAPPAGRPPAPAARRPRRRRRAPAASRRRPPSAPPPGFCSVPRGLTRAAGREGSRSTDPRRKDPLRRADHAGAVQRDAVPGRVRAPELQAAEGAPRRLGRDPGQGRLDGRLPGRRRASSTPARAGSGGC